MKSERLEIRMASETKEQLRELAEAADVSMAVVIDTLIKEKYEKEIAIRENQGTGAE